ncbi:aminopeptidase N [Mycetocola zhadangensis]|uniref:Aminopeptidase N n=1 Tax=Mycetocola zhadangensis TaxID=1164595 RepID=A0A3L7J5C7_9MICO|nr:aminopeptidase N [Mycetocola zhadangensis]RLQ85918.1 aminopeptidase N [Mycetocola zhadangensis]GGE86913.1 aminopeptidase N [Mycetocola zhadangensis]
MPGENLTRAEAQERASLVSTSSYSITLDLTTGPETFRSTTTVRFTATPGASTFIDAITRTVHSVTLNGVDLDPAVVSDGIRIALDNLQAENELVVDADMIYMNTGEGLHRFVDPVDNEVYLYSQFEVPDSRRMYAVFEQPDLKATFQFTVTAPEHWDVISNSPTPEPVAAGEGSKTWTFEPTQRMSSYITAIIAGPYVSVRSELTSSDGRTIPLGVFCRQSLAEYLDADYIFEKTRQGFEYFEKNFDYPYPFPKYDQLFVPEYNAGAMEHAGAVTFTEAYVFRSKVTDAIKERRVVTILHELAHMWFGDLVTMKWWNDLWLNESFAEWASTIAVAEATEWTGAWTTFNAMEKSWAYKQDQLPSTHPIVATINDLEDVQVNFDGITYAKGGSVLKQLVAWVGIEAFYAGVAAYFKKHEYGNTELVDLLSELEAASGRDLSNWGKLWLETAGVNTLRPEITVDDSGVITSFAVLQSAVEEYPTIRPHRLAIGFYNLVDGKLVREHRIELDVDGERTDVTEFVGTKRPDLVLLNDDDLAYAKIRLDDASLAVATESLAAIEDPLARSLVWAAAWDATRDAETPARDYVRLVLGNIATETESTTIRTTLNQLVLAATQYVAPDARDTVLVEIGDALWTLAQEAEAGSDAQFQFVKFFAGVASTEAHFDAIRGLRSGDISLDGLKIDTDLDWELLTALTAGGVAGNDDVNAALAGDNTANGAKAAALARAALPTLEAKRAAWASVVDIDTAPNAIVQWTGIGFQRARDKDVLASFIPDYFEMLQRIWASRSYKIAEYLAVGLYPAPLANTELRDATVAWLNQNAEPPALRRIVVENLAGVERALKAQERDARA